MTQEPTSPTPFPAPAPVPVPPEVIKYKRELNELLQKITTPLTRATISQNEILLIESYLMNWEICFDESGERERQARAVARVLVPREDANRELHIGHVTYTLLYANITRLVTLKRCADEALQSQAAQHNALPPSSAEPAPAPATRIHEITREELARQAAITRVYGYPLA